MTSPTVLTPVVHHVFNALDETGITLNLERLRGESNATYRQRLFDVGVRHANATYMGLVNGISRELGLSQYKAIEIEAVTDANGAYLLDDPAVEFDGPNCKLISNADPDNYVILQTIDCLDPAEDEWYIGGLIDTINATGFFTATLNSGADRWTRSSRIFNQSSLELTSSELIDSSSAKVQLGETDLVAGTIAVRSSNLRNRVVSSGALLNPGDYFIDLDSGMLFANEAPSTGSTIRYLHRTNPMTFWASPVIFHDLQSSDFLDKIFDQVLDGAGELQSGSPTVLGTYVLNQLHAKTSVFWGL